MAFNLSKLFGRGGETRLEGGKEGLNTGSSESIVILDNDGETEVARVAAPLDPLGIDKSSPKLSEFAMAGGDGDADAPGFVAPGDVAGMKITDGFAGPETAVVDAADYTIWRDNLRGSTPPPGILPYIEQSNLVDDGKFTASEDQLRTLVGRLQERGLIDTSTGEIVWADEATSNFTGSDEELGALIAWLQTTQPGSSESALDAGFTIADDLINEARAGGGYSGETEKNVVVPGDGDDAARSMQPDQQGFTSAEGRSMSFELFRSAEPGQGPQNLPEVGDEVIVSMLNTKNSGAALPIEGAQGPLKATGLKTDGTTPAGEAELAPPPAEAQYNPKELGVEQTVAPSHGDQPELQLVNGGVEHEDTWEGAARSMQPGQPGQGFMMQDGELYPRGLLLPYMEQDNLFQGTDEQMSQLVSHLRERGLIDTSTGEIVWADEATASATGSDEELGALVAWLRGNNLIDTSTGEIVWARQPGASGWYVPDMDSDQSGMAIENARSMQPGQQGDGFMMQDGELYPRGLRDMEIEMVRGGGGTAEGDAPQGTALFDADSGKGLLTEIGLPAATGYTATDDLWEVRGEAQDGSGTDNANRSMQPGQQGDGFLVEFDRPVPDAVVEDVTEHVLNVSGGTRPLALSGDVDPSTAIRENAIHDIHMNQGNTAQGQVEAGGTETAETDAVQDVFVTEVVDRDAGMSKVSVGGFGGGVDDNASSTFEFSPAQASDAIPSETISLNVRGDTAGDQEGGVNNPTLRSMQPGQEGRGFMMQDGELYPRGVAEDSEIPAHLEGGPAAVRFDGLDKRGGAGFPGGEVQEHASLTQNEVVDYLRPVSPMDAGDAASEARSAQQSESFSLNFDKIEFESAHVEGDAPTLELSPTQAADTVPTDTMSLNVHADAAGQVVPYGIDMVRDEGPTTLLDLQPSDASAASDQQLEHVSFPFQLVGADAPDDIDSADFDPIDADFDAPS